MSQRGSFVTEYIHCDKCFEAAKSVLLSRNKYLCSVVVPHWNPDREGPEMPIIAGEIDYAIHHDESGPVYLEDMEPKFQAMKCAGIPATEHIPHQKFWTSATKVINISVQPSLLPCECAT